MRYVKAAAAGAVPVLMTALIAAGGPARAEPVALQCTVSGNGPIVLFVSVDPEAATAKAYGPGIKGEDVRGLPAKVSANEVTWEDDNGVGLHEVMTLDRNTGALNEDAVLNGRPYHQSWVCSVARKVF